MVEAGLLFETATRNACARITYMLSPSIPHVIQLKLKGITYLGRLGRHRLMRVNIGIHIAILYA